MFRASSLRLALASFLCIQALLVSCSTPPPTTAAASVPAQGTRFPQTPEILALEKKVSADPAVLQVLGRRPGSRVKLRKLDQAVSAYVVEQRDGKWFNVSREMPPSDLAIIVATVRREAQASGQWEAVEVSVR